MSPTCMIKPKQSIYQSKAKPKYVKNKQKQKVEETMTTTETKSEIDEHIYIELDTKCSCSQSTFNNHPSIQFSRRYLHCQSSMPIAILRSYIQQILPHSSMTQVSLFDANDRLLNDTDLLRSLKHNTTSSTHIPIRFTLLNTITSLGHCSCSSSSSFSTIKQKSSSSSPSIIKRETIDQTLSTCSLIPSSSASTATSVYSPCLSSSSPPPLPLPGLSESSNSISIVNLLTPPLSHSSFLIENIVDSNQSIIDEITSKFGEICPPLLPIPTTKKSRNRLSKKIVSSNVPLDLSLKKRSSSTYDLFSSQAKWIKT